MRKTFCRPAPRPHPVVVEHERVIERPDGFYWTSPEGRDYGPFESLEAALQDMQDTAGDEALEGETLAEAEAELELPDHIDPELDGLVELDTEH